MVSRHFASEQLAEHLSESLRSQTDFVLCCGDVLAGQEAMWEALEVCSIGDDSGSVLLLALDNYRQQLLIEQRRAFAAAAHNSKLVTQIQVSSPWLIAELHALENKRFTLEIANCWRVIVFLTLSDLQDPMLDYCLDVIETAFARRQFGLCFFWDRHEADADMLSKRLRLKQSEHWQLNDVGKAQAQHLLYVVDEFNPAKPQLDASFWEQVGLKPSLASCHHYELCVSYAECAAHKKILSTGITSPNLKLRLGSQQHIALAPAFAPKFETNWKQSIILGLPERDTFGAATDHSFGGNEQASRLFIACSHHGILSFLTSSMDTNDRLYPEDRDILSLAAFLLFSRLANGETSENLYLCLNHLGLSSALSSSIRDASLESWAELIAKSPDGRLQLNERGLSRLHGIKHLSEIAPQLSLSPPVALTHPAGQGIGYLPKNIFRHIRRGAFKWNGHLYEHIFDDIRVMKSYLKPTGPEQRALWIDAEPEVLSLKRCQKIADILSQKASLSDIKCHKSTQERLQNLIEQLSAVTGHFPNVIAVSTDSALWWTFAGAEHNAQTAAILGLLSPALSVGYGNFCLRLNWCTDCGERAAPSHSTMMAELEDIRDSIRALAAENLSHSDSLQGDHKMGESLLSRLSSDGCLCLDVEKTDVTQPYKTLNKQRKADKKLDRAAIQEAWRELDPHDFLAPILPLFIQEARFSARLEKWSRIILEQPKAEIVVVEELVSIDPIIFAPPLLVKPVKASQETVKPRQADPSKANKPADTDKEKMHKEVQNAILAKAVMPLANPPQDGLMRTHHPWTLIETQKDFNSCLAIILKHNVIGLDVETTIFDHRLCLIQIGLSRESYIIDALKVDFDGLRQVFEHPNIIKVIHHAPFERSVLAKHQMSLNNVIDTCTVSRKHYGKVPGGHSLRAVCQREFGLDMDKTQQTSRWNNRPLSAAQLEYAALDAEILIHLYRKFFKA